MVDDGDLFRLEFSENEERKDFTLSEKNAMLEVLTPKRGGTNNSDGSNQYKNSSIGSKEPLYQNLTDERKDKRANAVGFSGKNEAKRVKRIQTKCIQEICDLVDEGDLAVTPTAEHISKLSEDDQRKVVDAVKKYGNWKLYEFHEKLAQKIHDNSISIEAGRIIQLKAKGDTSWMSRLISKEEVRIAKIKTHHKLVKEKEESQKVADIL